MANFYSAMAYPGSQLHIEAVKEKIKLPQTYSGYSQHSFDTQNLPSNNLEAWEILKFRDYAWDKFHTNPSYLNLIENKFGINSRKNLEDTTKIKLRRKIVENNEH
jgi:hypothetical protein